MGYAKRTALAVLAALMLSAAPPTRTRVIVVDGGKAERVQDPAVPSRAEIELGMPVGGRGPLGTKASASSTSGARASGESARAARAWRSARSSSRRGRRAVYAGAQPRAATQEDQGRRPPPLAPLVRALAAHAAQAERGRRTQLLYVANSVEALALSRRLTPTRMPVAFLQLERNRQYWRRLPYPATGAQVSFRGSQVLFQYFPGEGLQLHPLSTFKKANALHGFCERGEPECDEPALRTILDEMTALAVKRGRRFIAWEYLFSFGGGYPPWMSGMAQATGIQAYARASQLLEEPLLRGDREARARRLRNAPAHRRAHDRAGRRRPLPAVLVRAAAVDLQRLPAVADRASRLREDHR